MFVITIEIFFRFYLPILIIIGLVIGFWLNKDFFEKCSVDLRIISLLTLGVLSTSMINVPIIITGNTVLAVNFGSIIIPIIISLYFIYKIKLNSLMIISILIIVILSTYLLSYYDTNIGIILDFPIYFIPIFLSVILGILGASNRSVFEAVPIAYSICTLGVFLGADIFHIPAMLGIEHKLIGYFGGLGAFDFIYISGLYAIAFSLIIAVGINSNILIKTQVLKPEEARIKTSDMKKLEIRKHKKSNSKESIPYAWKQYEFKNFRFSSIRRRIIAFLIDSIIQFIIIGSLFIWLFWDNNIFGSISINLFEQFHGLSWIIFTSWAVVFHIFYFTSFEWFFGQTPGKMFIKIKVITLESSNRKKIEKHTSKYSNEFLTIFTRNVLRILELLLLLYIIGLILIYSTPNRQRIGDLCARTGVIRL